MNVKLRRVRRQKVGRQQFNVEQLRDPKVRNVFVLQLKNRFQALADMENLTQPEADEVNTKWESVKTAYLKTCLGTKQKERKEWITEDTWQTIERRRAVKK